MKVKVKFYADLKDRYAPNNDDGILEVQLENQSTINDVFEKLQIDDREIGFVILNDKKIQKDADLSEGDFIQIFAFVAGG